MAKTLERDSWRTPAAGLNPKESFQDLILTLQQFWGAQGCVILQPYDMEVGAGTFHPATTLRALGPKPWNAAYVQPSRRPKDGRYGENPNRLQHYYQFQVIMKPSPADILDLYLQSLDAIGIDTSDQRHPLRRGRLGKPDARRLGPRLGGLVQRHGGDAVHLFPAGRRLRLQSGRRARSPTGWSAWPCTCQGVDRVFDLNFNGRDDDKKLTYGDVFLQAEQEYSRFNFEHADTEILLAALPRCGEGVQVVARKRRNGGMTSICWRCRPTISASRRRTSSICWMRAA